METRVLVKGINWSGSGTVVDLLREYESVIQIPGGASEVAPAGYMKFNELRDYNLRGGIRETLATEITRDNLENLRRYILIRKKKLIKDIYRNIMSAKKITNKLEAINEFPLMWRLIKCTESYLTNLSLGLSQQERIELAMDWVQKIINTTRGKKDVNAVIFDQTVDLGETMEVWSQVFNPYKLIIVHRYPYDQLAEQIKKNYYKREWTKKLLKELYGNDPNAHIRHFAKQTDERQKKLERILTHLPKENVLLLRFEEIVLNYKKTKERIESFVGLKAEDHVCPQKHFKPDWSKNNIGVYEKSGLNFPQELMKPVLDWYKAHP